MFRIYQHGVSPWTLTWIIDTRWHIYSVEIHSQGAGSTRTLCASVRAVPQCSVTKALLSPLPEWNESLWPPWGNANSELNQNKRFLPQAAFCKVKGTNTKPPAFMIVCFCTSWTCISLSARQQAISQWLLLLCSSVTQGVPLRQPLCSDMKLFWCVCSFPIMPLTSVALRGVDLIVWSDGVWKGTFILLSLCLTHWSGLGSSCQEARVRAVQPLPLVPPGVLLFQKTRSRLP